MTQTSLIPQLFPCSQTADHTLHQNRTEHTLGNGNPYPTHGFGPVANYMGIQRGDRFAYIVSMSSPERGLDAYRKEHVKSDDPRMAERYIEGDMNTSLIKTANGLKITVKHAVSTPHPYDRINQIAGTKESLKTIRRAFTSMD